MRLHLPIPLVLALLLVLPARAADLAPLADQAPAWAKRIEHGAVATAEKRDGAWSFALAGQPFAEGHAVVPAEQVELEIGSISKVFTAIVLAKAVSRGKLSLDDTLAKRLPVTFDDPALGAVTLRQLATHSSCLPRVPENLRTAGDADPYATYDESALFSYLAHAKLDGKPPCGVTYSNLGFGVLGVVLEHALGKPWATLVEESVTGPLGMKDTVVVLSPDQSARFALPWDGAKAASPWTFQAMAGAGALRSTLGDLARLADAMLLADKGPLADAWPLLSSASAEMPSAGGTIGLALIHAQDHGESSFEHDGGTGGYRSHFAIYPDSGRAAIVLVSNASAEPGAWVAEWRGSTSPKAPPPSAITLPNEALDAYVGVYAMDSTRFTVLRDGGGLVVRLTGQPFLPIFPSAKDDFFYRAVEARITFDRDASGAVTGLVLHQNGHDMKATRTSEPLPTIIFPNQAALDEYAGTYDFGAFMPGGTFVVTAKGGTLAAQLTGQPAIPVFATAKDAFAYDVVVASLSFERDATGKVAALVLHQNGADMRAPRK